MRSHVSQFFQIGPTACLMYANYVQLGWLMNVETEPVQQGQYSKLRIYTYVIICSVPFTHMCNLIKQIFLNRPNSLENFMKYIKVLHFMRARRNCLKVEEGNKLSFCSEEPKVGIYPRQKSFFAIEEFIQGKTTLHFGKFENSEFQDKQPILCHLEIETKQHSILNLSGKQAIGQILFEINTSKSL